jgi:hypothetical protein
MEQLVDHDAFQLNQDGTTAWERFLSLLVAFWSAVVGFFKSLGPSKDYMPRVYTPRNPVYLNARKRDPATIITNVLTDEMRDAQAQRHGDGPDADAGDGGHDWVKPASKEDTREFERVSIREFVESRCPTMSKGGYSHVQ